MAARKGSLLEKQVADIFSTAGFDTNINEYVAGYETDVHAFLGDVEVVAECKQYEQSNLTVRNIIHEWNGKNEAIEADKVILVIYGQEVSDEDYELAENYGMSIWDEEKLEDLMGLDDDALQQEVLSSIDTNEEELGTKHDKEIRKLLWKPYLSYEKEDEDESYHQLLQFAKRRIRRKLFQRGTSKKERQKHISFFERVTKDRRYRSEKPVDSDKEKFNLLGESLSNGEHPFSDGRASTYENYLSSVKETYKSAKKYYLKSSGKDQIRRLIDSRVEDVYHNGGNAKLADLNDAKPVTVGKEGGTLSVSLDLQDSSNLEIIRWTLMREGVYETKDITNEDGEVVDRVTNVFFEYSDPDDCAEAVFRIFDEFFNYDHSDLRLIDLTYTEPPESRCFIATAAYGTEMHPDLDILRSYRDQTLAASLPGRLLIKTYYTVSPPMARFISKHKTLQKTVRTLISPIITYLQKKGY